MEEITMLNYYSEGKEFKFTQAMKDYTEEKTNKLLRILDTVEGNARVKKNGHQLKLEIDLGGVRASKTGTDFYALVIDVVDQLETQIKKYRSIRKEKTLKSKVNNVKDIVDNIIYEEEDDLIQREKFVILDNLTDIEAIEKMELLGHSFFVYNDIDRKAACVIYRRNSKGYGILITK
jgi:putative sigma-54 modulation protein